MKTTSFLECSQFELVWCVLVIRLWLCSFFALISQRWCCVLLSASCHIMSGDTWYQHALLLVLVNLITWLTWCLLDFSTIKLFFLLQLKKIWKELLRDECSNYCTIALISYASKVMLKISKPGLNYTWTLNFQMFKLVLGKAVATHSSTLAWKVPWMEEPGELQ